MGPLVAIGGVSVPAENLHSLECGLSELCRVAGFPALEPFKWSPGRNLWMRENLVREARTTFFLAVLAQLRQAGAVALVVASDVKCRTATNAKTPEADVTNLILERVHLHLVRSGRHGLVISDRPSGGRPDEENFLVGCLEMRQEGAGYVVPGRISLNVLSSPSKFIRLLQAADLVTSCTLAYVSGEKEFAPPVFEQIRAMLFSDGGRIGGMGLKLHPDFKFANLYHWLVGDDTFWRFNLGVPMPLNGRPYKASPDDY